MKSILCLVAGIVIAALLAVACSQSEASTTTSDRVAYGRHLVENVAGCVDCHSPRGPDGQFVAGRELAGTPLFFKPTGPMPVWAATAPRLAGLPAGFTEEQLAHFLMTGETPKGIAPPRPPMPPFRMNQQEAEAVAAFIKSLGGQTGM